MNNTFEREFDWNDTIENDSSFVLLPEGEYEFTVTKFERGRHPGSDKLPPCNKAILTLSINSPEGNAVLTHNLFLHTKCEGMLCAFFTAIGHRKHGEKLQMDWNKVFGAKGRAKIGIRTWKSKDGNDMQSNEIKSFIEPSEDTTQASGFTAGNF